MPATGGNHNHNRDGQGGACTCGHEHDDVDPSGDSLYNVIDIDNVRALNEARVHMCRDIFKPYDQRQDRSKWLDSQDDDPELIVHIPFLNGVKIKGITISGEQGEKHPSEAKLFVNRDDIDFTNAHDLKPAQTLDLNEDTTGDLVYPLKTSKFYGVRSLTIFFSDTLGGDSARIFYIGLKGVNQKIRRDIVHAVYETQPAKSDSQIRDQAKAPDFTGYST